MVFVNLTTIRSRTRLFSKIYANENGEFHEHNRHTLCILILTTCKFVIICFSCWFIEALKLNFWILVWIFEEIRYINPCRTIIVLINTCIKEKTDSINVLNQYLYQRKIIIVSLIHTCNNGLGLLLWCLTSLSTIFQLYRDGHWGTRIKLPTCRKSPTNFIT
jgi:hypothetical protein